MLRITRRKPLGLNVSIYYWISLISLLVLVWGLCQNNCYAQSMRFSTSDGKFSIDGEIIEFKRNGTTIETPSDLSPDMKIVIKRKDGLISRPVSIGTLSDGTVNSIKAYLVNYSRTSQRSKSARKSILSAADVGFQENLALLKQIFQVYRSKKNSRDQTSLGDLSQSIQILDEKTNRYHTDGVFDFVLRTIESDLGKNNMGILISIAKTYDGHWYAWRAAIASTIRYQGVARVPSLFTQLKSELVTYSEKRLAETPNRQGGKDLSDAAKAIAWLQDTAKLIVASEATNSAVLNSLSADKDLQRIAERIEDYKQHLQDVIDQRNETIADNEAAKREELIRLAREATLILSDWRSNYDRIWVIGLTAFASQLQRYESVANDYINAFNAHSAIASQLQFAKQTLESAKSRVRSETSRQTSSSSKSGSSSSLSSAIADEAEATVKVAILDGQEQALRAIKNQLELKINAEEAKLMHIYQQLASFANDAKNMAILFEHKYRESMLLDTELKDNWIDFTNKLKLILSQLPSMPTINISRLASREAREKQLIALSKNISLDIEGFLSDFE